MHSSLPRWLEFYETKLLGRRLGPEEYIFPTITWAAGKANVMPHQPLSSDQMQVRIERMTAAAGVVGHFSTHCFRRGSAQYRFMFAPIGQRWTLNKIRWWGGWAEGEHVCQ